MGFFGKPEVVGRLDDHRLTQLEERVRRLEATVAALGVPANAPGAAPVEPFWAEASLLKRQGKAIAAVKLVREQTGLGLREAKDAVDRLG